ncbi:Uncharacterised protein [Rhodococcus wratislaviensis]|uniref:Uncharacterized protein n=1 Tax=Rhodococcus wratislaviensis TaxID=44752 RepID=A0AB38FH33_RHOWR|nr:Uncharacterised protein [Rhodococcus wratislaviensis]
MGGARGRHARRRAGASADRRPDRARPRNHLCAGGRSRRAPRSDLRPHGGRRTGHHERRRHPLGDRAGTGTRCDSAPRLVHRRRGGSRGSVQGNRFRSRAGIPHPVSPHQIRGGEAGPGSRGPAVAHLPPLRGGRQFGHGRDGQDRRPVLPLPRRRGARETPLGPTRCRPPDRIDQRRTRRLRGRGHRGVDVGAGTGRPDVPSRQSASPAGPRDLRRARRGRRRSACRSQPARRPGSPLPHSHPRLGPRHGPQGGTERSRHPSGARREHDPAHGVRERRHAGGAARHRHRRPAVRLVRRQAVVVLAREPRSGSGAPAPSGRTARGQARGDHRGVVRDRPEFRDRDGPQGREGDSPRPAHRGTRRRGGRDPRDGRRGLRLPLRHHRRRVGRAHRQSRSRRT